MVILIQSTEELMAQREKDGQVGIVPTMGNLHKGHISLLNEALRNYKTVYFTIFVNPTQFGPNEDFTRYPRTLDRDLELIREKQKEYPESKIVVFSPKDPKEIYPEDYDQVISVKGLSTDLEGKIRPGHFDGVATVVYRLFELIKPSTAYFGLKDYQQYLVVSTMVRDLALPIKIQGMPIIREASGLAMSSRNQYLSNEQRDASLIIIKTLSEVKNTIDGDKKNLVKAKSLIANITADQNWDYLELRDSVTFSQDLTNSKNISILAVYRMGTTRLLDNMQVEVQ